MQLEYTCVNSQYIHKGWESIHIITQYLSVFKPCEIIGSLYIFEYNTEINWTHTQLSSLYWTQQRLIVLYSTMYNNLIVQIHIIISADQSNIERKFHTQSNATTYAEDIFRLFINQQIFVFNLVYQTCSILFSNI